MSSVDAGTLDLPLNLGDADKGLKNDVLARLATSISPGGSHRSGNQPYWKADKADEQIITDQEIQAALDRAKADGRQFSFIKSVGDFRTRLNEMSCTGCHQTRAIAGFHFPGADRKATPRVNAVLLPGSPHFYGDQVRRKEILEKLANGNKPRLTEYDLAVGYAARPLNRFQQQLKETQLIGGWGAACLVANHLASSQRQWTCREDLTCAQLFASANDPGIGTCVPEGRTEVGDALQRGRVITTAFGHDRYVRVSPKGLDTRIPRDVLPADQPPNSYYGAHQEFYGGNARSMDPAVRRDAKTGGFPSGMLRLSECVGLPCEATCGLLASSGFTDCIARVATDPKNYTLDRCFKHFTSYGGVRACDPSNPCRDDYICMRSIGYTPKTAKDQFAARRSAIKSSPYFKQITGRDYDPKDYGELEPDAAWVARNDRRGICIPPYFVFQFRSDRHPRPPQ